MALANSTAAQRAELQAACNMAAKYLHRFEEDGYLDVDNTELLTTYQTLITRVQTAITAIANAS